jgi:hypothetical protein
MSSPLRPTCHLVPSLLTAHCSPLTVYSGDVNNRPQRTAVRKGKARQLLGS